MCQHHRPAVRAPVAAGGGGRDVERVFGRGMVSGRALVVALRGGG